MKHYVISRNCFGVLQLYLESCRGITGKGVMHAVENCTQLREINLRGCDNVNDDDIVASMVFSRPSLKKIIVPPYYRIREQDKEFFLSDVCLIF
ncbi:putative leucine-rich repeat domain, L domain-containing protein [Medicago truncatula]|uniref:Putative leucine-rich repeat domain, L domain-containing protein n=1 Tax=Medicago truncatula TaxID=3880 RepID=A0A396HYA0_MEDTR|nr:putative leucine-rich repeat domain, L domain-containing protein [Medicago truncatula]